MQRAIHIITGTDLSSASVLQCFADWKVNKSPAAPISHQPKSSFRCCKSRSQHDVMQPANAPVSFKRQNSAESSAHSAQAGLLSTWIPNGGWTKHPALLINDKLALSYDSCMEFGAYLRQLLIVKIKLKAVVFLWLQASQFASKGGQWAHLQLQTCTAISEDCIGGAPL